MQTESGARRVCAYLLDMLFIMAIGLFAGYQISEMGTRQLGMPISLGAAAYFLFRDIAGASLGKLAMGLRVVASNGGRATATARILRNVTVALGPALASVVPAGGFAGDVARLIGAAAVLVEIGFVYKDGHRLGDRIAGTAVVSRTAAEEGQR